MTLPKYELSVNDNIWFQTMTDVCNTLFDAGYKGAVQKIKNVGYEPFKDTIHEGQTIWFPFLEGAMEKWHNKLSDSGLVIIETNLFDIDRAVDIPKGDESISVAFGGYKKGYKFIGVFRFVNHFWRVVEKDEKPVNDDDKERRVRIFERISDTCEVKNDIKSMIGDKHIRIKNGEVIQIED